MAKLGDGIRLIAHRMDSACLHPKGFLERFLVRRLRFSIIQLLSVILISAVTLTLLRTTGWLNNSGVYRVRKAELVEVWSHEEDETGNLKMSPLVYWTWTVQNGRQSVVYESEFVDGLESSNPLPEGTLFRIVNGRKFSSDPNCVPFGTAANQFAQKLPPGSDTEPIRNTLAAIAVSVVAIGLWNLCTRFRKKSRIDQE